MRGRRGGRSSGAGFSLASVGAAEILQHADQLSARFEDYQPDPADELDPRTVAMLRAAVQQRSDAERHILDAIRAARQAGMSWSAIGIFVGTSGEAARQRYGRRDW